VEIAVLLFDRLTALDAVGPYEVLSRIPGATVTFVATEPGALRSDTGSLALLADRTLSELPRPDVVVVPGGVGHAALLDDEAVLSWLRAADQTSTWTTSVCTGALLLAAAGLLKGRRATTHWLAMKRLAELGAEPVAQRVVVDGKLVTSAGVSAGIDMGLTLASLIAGERVAKAIQLGIEYDPRPPFDAGSPDKAPPDVVEFVRSARQATESTTGR
jgi:transcriptional regulator GlxA family with amidase domain